MDPRGVTQDAILDAMREALAAPPFGDGFTIVELAAQIGCTSKRVQQKIKAMLASGEAELVTLRRQKINGVSATFPGFRLK